MLLVVVDVPVPVLTVELFLLTVVACVLLFVVVTGAVRVVVCVLLFTTASELPRETELLSLMMVAGVLLSLLYKSTLFTVLVRVSMPLLRIVLVVRVRVLTLDVFLIALLESVARFTTPPDSLAILCLSLVTTAPLLTAGL